MRSAAAVAAPRRPRRSREAARGTLRDALAKTPALDAKHAEAAVVRPCEPELISPARALVAGPRSAGRRHRRPHFERRFRALRTRRSRPSGT
jgi:hypothetical protein